MPRFLAAAGVATSVEVMALRICSATIVSFPPRFSRGDFLAALANYFYLNFHVKEQSLYSLATRLEYFNFQNCTVEEHLGCRTYWCQVRPR
jgi:hypothetical protein